MSKQPILPQSIAFDYEILKKIGEGACGETWLLQHRIEKKRAVLKFLKLQLAGDLKAIELFEREAKLLQSVSVRGIPKFYGHFTDEEGNGCLLQEYIPYPSLQTLLDGGKKFTERETLHIARRIAAILLQLQTQYSPPIIHRDIKPSNILYNEQFHEVYLIDFGAVAHPQKRDGGSTVAGTFGYMPPEQIFGNIAIQSDFYALGATMLHMLTGRFPGEISAQVYQIDVHAILREKAPDASPNMTALLASMLSADIDKRPPTAAQLCKSLNHVLAYPKDGIWQKISEKFAAMDNNFHRMMRVETIGNADNNPRKERWRRIKKIVAHPLWKTTKGTIQYSHIKQNNSEANVQENSIKELVIEYTFEAHKRTWKGTAEISKIQINYPAPCLIRYDRLFPSNNMLFAIEKNAKI